MNKREDPLVKWFFWRHSPTLGIILAFQGINESEQKDSPTLRLVTTTNNNIVWHFVRISQRMTSRATVKTSVMRITFVDAFQTA